MATTMPYGPIPDQTAETMREIARIKGQLDQFGIDDQEMQERQDAAQAYAGENPQHFVDYAEECVRNSNTANREVRLVQRQCWDVYQEKEPPNYAAKTEWQSQAVLPKPFSAVKFAVAQVKSAFSPTFLSIRNEPDGHVNLFWTRLMQRQLDEQHANFVIRFGDATEMAFAVGTAFEMIPLWDTTRNCLTYSLVEPWKIDRDPDAQNREPQSGLYWVHTEYVDYHVLREGEKQGLYRDTLGLNNIQQHPVHMGAIMQQQTEQARLRQQVYSRNKYRRAILTREFWGTVLSPGGEMLLPSSTFTTAGGRVIALPEPTPYSTLRWPGVSFSPLPHLLRFDGRSLLQSVRSLWYYMCNLLALHADYQNWIVNPMREVNQRGLVDQEDIDPYPGKVYLTRDTVSGQMVVRTVDQRFVTNDILANQGHLDQVFQRGTMVTDVVQGLPGYREDITARESAQHLAQSRTAFTDMGMNLDNGAIQAILAGMETVRLNANRESILEAFSEQELIEMFGEGKYGPGIFVDPSPEAPNGVMLPRLRGNVHVSGLQTLLQDHQELDTIEKIVLPLMQDPRTAPFIQLWRVMLAIEKRANLEDEHLFVTEDEAKQIVQQQAEQQQQVSQLQQAQMQEQIALQQTQRQLAVRAQMLKEAQVQLDAQQMAVEVQLKQLEFAQAAEEHQADRARLLGELATTAAEIEQLRAQVQQTIVQTGTELAMTDAQIQKIMAGIAAQDEKLAIQRRQVEVQAMAARRQVAGGQNGSAP